MAEENSDSGEKEFEATEQRLREARREGNVPQSKEANSFALIAGMLLSLIVFGAIVARPMFERLSALFYHADSFADDVFSGSGETSRQWMLGLLLQVVPVFVLMVALVLGALVIQRAIAFSTKKIKPDMNKLNPAENLKKKYGPKGLLDFLKDTAKMLFAGLIAAVFLYAFARQ